MICVGFPGFLGFPGLDRSSNGRPGRSLTRPGKLWKHIVFPWFTPKSSKDTPPLWIRCWLTTLDSVIYYCITLHSTALHCILSYYTVLYYTTLYYTVSFVLYGITMYYIAVCYITLYHVILYYTVSSCIIRYYTVLIMLHYTALHCIVLYYTILY